MFKSLFRAVSLGLSGLALTACSVSPEVYKEQTPALDITQFLNGKLLGWGIFEQNGEVTKRFHIEMDAHWEGNKGTFIEHFTFNDGTKQVRSWDITRLNEHEFTGVANDSVGIGRGQMYGNSMHWNYTITTPTERGTYDLDYDYWMHLVDSNTLINRATLSKFGIPLGDISVTFRKQ